MFIETEQGLIAVGSIHRAIPDEEGRLLIFWGPLREEIELEGEDAAETLDKLRALCVRVAEPETEVE